MDEKGNVVDGDLILTVWADELKKEGKLKKNTIVGTVMTNLGIENYLKEKGIKMIRTNIGDKYVVDEMLKCGYNLGGEQSGHIICLDYSCTGDGAITSVQMAYIMMKNNKALSELIQNIHKYPQALKNIKIPETFSKYEVLRRLEALSSEIGKLQKQIKGRILIRPSGTEPKIRIMVEDEDNEKVQNMINKIEELIKQKLTS